MRLFCFGGDECGTVSLVRLFCFGVCGAPAIMISPVVVISPTLPFPDWDRFRGDKDDVRSDAAVVVIPPSLVPFTAFEIFFCGDERNCRSDGVPS